MSLADGWAAINLEAPPKVPRTEYSLESHWPLIERVTGVHAEPGSDDAAKGRAAVALFKAWDFSFLWRTLISADIFGEHRTRMGHAVYQAGATDYDPVVGGPFKDADDVLAFDAEAYFGERAPSQAQIAKAFEEDYRARVAFYADACNMTGIYVSCMSGLIDLFGWQLLLEALGQDPAGFGRVTQNYGRFIGRYFRALADAKDVPLVMVHDDLVWTSGAFANPAWYRAYIFPTLKACLAPVVESGKKIAFTSDGNFTEFIDDVAALGVNGFVLEPTTDMAYIAEKYGRTHFFIGNADTRVLLSGTREQIEAEVRRCMGIGKRCPGFFLAVGNHIPPNTPVESVLWYNDCYERLSRR